MIRLYLLNGAMMDGREAMHTHLYMQFALPAYYGRNLDALWDCLTEKEPGCIVLQHAECMDKATLLPLTGLLLDLVRQNDGWQLQLSTGSPDCHGDGAQTACDGDCSACAGCEACAPADAETPADAEAPACPAPQCADDYADDCGCFLSDASCEGGADADGAADGCPFEL